MNTAKTAPSGPAVTWDDVTRLSRTTLGWRVGAAVDVDQAARDDLDEDAAG